MTRSATPIDAAVTMTGNDVAWKKARRQPQSDRDADPNFSGRALEFEEESDPTRDWNETLGLA
jgi:hypothetical protein